jgi:hypothetical protein
MNIQLIVLLILISTASYVESSGNISPDTGTGPVLPVRKVEYGGDFNRIRPPDESTSNPDLTADGFQLFSDGQDDDRTNRNINDIARNMCENVDHSFYFQKFRMEFYRAFRGLGSNILNEDHDFNAVHYYNNSAWLITQEEISEEEPSLIILYDFNETSTELSMEVTILD